ncbi:MAG: hypothetical protein GVY19_00160 [Bacteroidetes bacterium]|jgi:hypothetical protein|nr:hypothetical protein [Bacteroidota bacterium]
MTETLIKDMPQTKTEFKVVQTGDKIHSINKSGKPFHFIDLSYLKDNILFHGWLGYRTNEQIQEVLDGHFIELYEKHKCKNMLINNQEMTGTFAGINDWLGTYFMPKMINMGLKNNAVVLPSNVFAQLAVEDWDEKVGGFTSRNFGNLDEAINWLKSA